MKYKINGEWVEMPIGTTVEANPEVTSQASALSSIKIGRQIYKIDRVESGEIKEIEIKDIEYYAWSGEFEVDGTSETLTLFTKTTTPDTNSHVYAYEEGYGYIDGTDYIPIITTDGSTYIEVNILYQGITVTLNRDEEHDDGVITTNKYLSLKLTDNSEINVDFNSIPDKNNPRFIGNFAMNGSASSNIGKYAFAEGAATSEATGTDEGYDGNFIITYKSEENNMVTFETNIPKEFFDSRGEEEIILMLGTSYINEVIYVIPKMSSLCTISDNELILHKSLITSDDYTSINNQSINNYLYIVMVSNESSGMFSHAEGSNTTAYGMVSHAEGYRTEANGDYSHSEGESTIASGEHQHVSGKYNIEDTQNKYAHIIGNGTSNNNRSNAMTVDWDGNLETAGTVNGYRITEITQVAYDALPTPRNSHIIYLIKG